MKLHYSNLFIVALFLFLIACDDARQLPEETLQQPVKSDTFRLAYTPLPIDSVYLKGEHVFYTPTVESEVKIICLLFDPQGKPEHVITKYKPLAKKYHIMLAGTKTSKNGVELSQAILAGKKLMKELSERLQTDSLHVYVSGFSGGTQVAMQLADEISSNGVIYSGTPGQLPKPNIPLLGFAGNMDMNYADLLRFAKNIPNSYTHTLIRYAGKHEWPALPVMELAFYWMHCAVQHQNDCALLIPESLLASAQKNIPATFQKYQSAAFRYFMLRTKNEPASLVQNELEAISRSTDYQKQLEKENNDISMELRLKEFYTDAVFGRDKAWWSSEINRLKQQQSIQPTNARLLGYFSLLAYSLGNKALNSNDTALSAKILHIYRLADPDNAEQCYMQARLQAQKGNKPSMLAHLQEAVAKGLSDKDKLLHSDFTPYLSESELQGLIQKMQQ